MDTAFATRADSAADGSPPPAPTPASRRRACAFAAILSGVLVTLCFPHADLGPLAWFALVPFLRTFPHARTRTAALYGYLFGFIYYAGVAYWMGVFADGKIGPGLGIVALILVGLIHGPWMALLAAGTNRVWQAGLAWRLIAIPAVWVVVEWLAEKGTFGMGWGDLGYTQWRDIPVMQVAALTGVWGITALIVFVNVSLASANRPAIAAAAVAMAIVFGAGALAARPSATGTPLTVAAIQPDINQDVEWSSVGRPADNAYFYSTLAAYDRLCALAASGGAKLIVLPETAAPGYIMTDPELRTRTTQWAVANHAAILTGGRYFDPIRHNDQNVVFQFTQQGELTGRYAKTKLVPFGEYVPYRKIFAFLNNLQVSIGDIEAGSETQPPLDTGLSLANGTNLKLGPMICFESTYSRFARRQAAKGAGILAVVTDDAWFGRTAAAKQHLAMSAIRAAETHRALVRAAASGISAVFDSRGRMVKQLGWYRQGVVVATVTAETDMTPYVRFGDWFVVVSLIIAVAGVAISSRRESL